MAARARPSLLRTQRPSTATGIAVAVGAVAAATALVYPLKLIAPTVSLGVVYLPAVLLVSAYWGLGLGLFTSVLSAAAFNFFHIPPVGHFTIAEGRNWVALGAFFIVAAVTSTVAELARTRAIEAESRRREADLAANLARELLAGAATSTALGTTARRVAEVLNLPSAAIDLGTVEPDQRRLALALRDGQQRQIATLLVPADVDHDARERLRTQIVPTLEALIAIALQRDRLQSEAVETEALRRSDDVKTALLRAVSHDLRTPLTGIVAAGHALGGRSVTDEERDELSAAVVSEGERLSALVDKLLDLSRLQAGRAEPRRRWTSLEDVLLAARDAVGPGPGQIVLTVEPDLPAVLADAAQLERAFANLLENARRYSSGLPVSVRARMSTSGVVVRVADRGPGIPAAEQARIFEPFYRGSGNGQRPWTGSGLGLAIAKGFVEANGGRIAVESLPDQGTSFVVVFPGSAAEVTA
jgi:two-component system, OmpR family, sensor histidine kinase KdpD